MNRTQHRSPRIGRTRRLGHGLARAASAMAAVMAECHRTQRHMAQVRLHPDLYALDGDAAPATYGEFLFRSPGTVWHEPSARERDCRAPHKPLGRSR